MNNVLIEVPYFMSGHQTAMIESVSLNLHDHLLHNADIVC